MVYILLIYFYIACLSSLECEQIGPVLLTIISLEPEMGRGILEVPNLLFVEKMNTMYKTIETEDGNSGVALLYKIKVLFLNIILTTHERH